MAFDKGHELARELERLVHAQAVERLNRERAARAAQRAHRSSLPAAVVLAALTATFVDLIPGVANIPATALVASVSAFADVALSGLGNADGGSSQASGVAGILLLSASLRRLGVDGGTETGSTFFNPQAPYTAT
jgi:hypothetical protein